MTGRQIKLKSGRTVTFDTAMDERRAADSALWLWTRRAIGLAEHDDPDITEYQLDDLEFKLDELADEIAECRQEIDAVRKPIREREKIAALRNRRGGTDAEIQTGHRLADRLERKQHESDLTKSRARPCDRAALTTHGGMISMSTTIIQIRGRQRDRGTDPCPSVEQRDAMHRAALTRRLVEVADALVDETPPSRELDMLQAAVCDALTVVAADYDMGLIDENPDTWFA